jgi:hypothetical protein
MDDKLYAGTRLKVPATYQSDEGPRLELRGLETDFAGGEQPVNLTLRLRCNAEAVRRLAQFFDLYGQREEWNKRAAPGMILPPAREPGLRGVRLDEPRGAAERTLPLFEDDEEDCDVG